LVKKLLGRFHDLPFTTVGAVICGSRVVKGGTSPSFMVVVRLGKYFSGGASVLF
jgi:hypothetical protein